MILCFQQINSAGDLLAADVMKDFLEDEKELWESVGETAKKEQIVANTTHRARAFVTDQAKARKQLA